MNFLTKRDLTLQACRDVVSRKPEFREIQKNGYIVFDYSVALETTFDCDVSREMRGIAFCAQTSEIVSRPFHKFFNLNEKPDTLAEVLNFNQYHEIMEKLDGSMIRAIRKDNGFVWGTRAGETDVSAKVDEFLKNHPLRHLYEGVSYAMVRANFTPIFEFCSRAQRIVIDYPEPKLVLTAIRDNANGNYLTTESLYRIAEGLPVVDVREQITSGDFQQFHKNITELKDAEGVVIRFYTGTMVKMKAADYVLKHKTLDGLRFEKDVIKMHLEGLLDDVYPILSADQTSRIKEHVEAFDTRLKKTAEQIREKYMSVSHIESQKDFAEAIKGEEFSSIMFSVRSKKCDIMELLLTDAIKSTGNRAKMAQFKNRIQFSKDYA